MKPGNTPSYRNSGFDLYVEPDPVSVPRLWRTHGLKAVAERFFCKLLPELSEIRARGEALLRDAA